MDQATEGCLFEDSKKCISDVESYEEEKQIMETDAEIIIEGTVNSDGGIKKSIDMPCISDDYIENNHANEVSGDPVIMNIVEKQNVENLHTEESEVSLISDISDLELQDSSANESKSVEQNLIEMLCSPGHNGSIEETEQCSVKSSDAVSNSESKKSDNSVEGVDQYAIEKEPEHTSEEIEVSDTSNIKNNIHFSELTEISRSLNVTDDNKSEIATDFSAGKENQEKITEEASTINSQEIPIENKSSDNTAEIEDVLSESTSVMEVTHVSSVVENSDEVQVVVVEKNEMHIIEQSNVSLNETDTIAQISNPVSKENTVQQEVYGVQENNYLNVETQVLNIVENDVSCIELEGSGTSHTAENVVIVNVSDISNVTNLDAVQIVTENILVNEGEINIPNEPDNSVDPFENTEPGTTDEIVIHNVENVIVVQADDLSHNTIQSEIVQVATLPESKSKESSSKKGESRKRPKIPSHVLGRNVENPAVDVVSNGRMIPKPRLGVKIPYKNLTSQIVSKQDITNEIMERSRLKNPTHDPPLGGDVVFTNKLTQRLAKRIGSPQKKTETEKSKVPILSTIKKENVKVADNSDLIAILEGDVEVDWTEFKRPHSSKTPEESSNVTDLQKDLERQIALKQLRELPKLSKSYQKRFPPKEPVVKIISAPKTSVPKTTLTQTTSSPKITSAPKTSTSVPKSTITPKITTIPKVSTTPKTTTVPKTITATKSTAAPQPVSPEKITTDTEIKDDINSEPRFSSKLVTKTYTRKRKSSDIAPVLNADSPKHKKPEPSVEENKTPSAVAPNTYISKSSRIVKKKVIWDPHEVTFVKTKAIKPVRPPKYIHTEKQQISISKQVGHKVNKQSLKVIYTGKDKPKIKKVIKKHLLLKKGKPKRLTEIDKLLMDEGAINMLYSVKNVEDGQNTLKQKKRKVISLDKAQKELLNKTNEIRNDLQLSSNKISPKSLRKKESPAKISGNINTGVLSKKRNKDSVRSSLSSPPVSPGPIFQQSAEASRIIRRHSSSSFSSVNSDSEIEKKLSDKTAQQKANIDGGKATAKVKKREIFTSLASHKHKRPKLKSDKENVDGHFSGNCEAGYDEIIRSEDKTDVNLEKCKEKLEKINEKPTEEHYLQFKTLEVRKSGYLVHVIMKKYNDQNIFNTLILREMRNLLNKLRTDSNCRMVLVSSTGNSFNRGIDYKLLANNDIHKCKFAATEMAKCVSEFLKCLANFPKVIVAGVHEKAVGMGVMMLPLFDMVVASSKATFKAPYAHLGCSPEGASLLTLPHFRHNALACELFFASRTLTAIEAQGYGLVTRILSNNKFEEEIVSELKIMASQSSQSMEATKKLLRRHWLADIQASLTSETDVLIEHWTSVECQKNFRLYKISNE